MKLSLFLVSLLIAGATAAVPRASLVDDNAAEKTEFKIQTHDEVLGGLKFKQWETSVEKGTRRKIRNRRRLGGKGSNTAAPTETPEFFFEVDDDDSIVTTLLNGGFTYIEPFKFISDCIGDFSCEGRMETHVTGVMDGHECSVLALAAGAIGNPGLGKFAVTCPTAMLGATGTVIDCMDSLDPNPNDMTSNCDLLSQPGFGFEERGSGVTFTMPAVGVNVIVEVKCCDL